MSAPSAPRWPSTGSRTRPSRRCRRGRSLHRDCERSGATHRPLFVMPGLVPGIHDLGRGEEIVDARDERGHGWGGATLGCFVALLLAMTEERAGTAMAEIPQPPRRRRVQ